MRTSELTNYVPGIMDAHPFIAWKAAPGAKGADLVVTLRLTADPARAAEVLVRAGGEVFLFRFAGHESADFAYHGDADQLETLTERLELVSLALTGPTRVVVTTAGNEVVRSEMVIDPEGVNPQRDTVASWPLRRLRSRLLLRPVTEQVLDFERVSPI